jgi:hypothetical protein
MLVSPAIAIRTGRIAASAKLWMMISEETAPTALRRQEIQLRPRPGWI